MNYTDSNFYWFFAIVFIVYYLMRSAMLQVVVLVFASLFFYAWESPSLLIVFITSWFITGLTSYGVLTAISPSRAKAFATLGVATNLILLAFFKYKFLVIGHWPVDYSSHSIGGWLLLAPLPIGISFYTFHGISLLVDSYRGNAGVSVSKDGGLVKHLADTLLYLVFFPQLIAGPIIKAKDFYPQVHLKRFREIEWSKCFHILIVGYFLKSVVADNLTEQTFWIAYPYFQSKSSLDLLLMLYGYSAQIFADYAGYSLIAIGSAKLLGYKLPDNFNFPYISSSISEFWRRWNISLSSWLRDYLYIPLGGNKHGEVRTYVNLIIVMFLGGLWHGAAWSFAVWGLWHGIGLAIERPFMRTRFMRSSAPLIMGIRMFLVFNFVTLGWLFFKLQDFSQAWSYLISLFNSNTKGITPSILYYVLILSFPVFIYHLLSLRKKPIYQISKDIMYGAMIFLILTNAGPVTPFIYFQF